MCGSIHIGPPADLTSCYRPLFSRGSILIQKLILDHNTLIAAFAKVSSSRKWERGILAGDFMHVGFVVSFPSAHVEGVFEGVARRLSWCQSLFSWHVCLAVKLVSHGKLLNTVGAHDQPEVSVIRWHSCLTRLAGRLGMDHFSHRVVPGSVFFQLSRNFRGLRHLHRKLTGVYLLLSWILSFDAFGIFGTKPILNIYIPGFIRRRKRLLIGIWLLHIGILLGIQIDILIFLTWVILYRQQIHIRCDFSPFLIRCLALFVFAKFDIVVQP